MSLAEDLLDQALFLTNRDQRRPKQANLRRAVSSLYYALFHLLVDDASVLLFSNSSKAAASRLLVTRSFAHGSMKKAAAPFKAAGDLSRLQRECWHFAYGDATPLPTANGDLRLVAGTFLDLQEQRHKADYDKTASFARTDVEARCETARKAFVAWRKVRDTRDAHFFLTALLLRDLFDSRP